jgi:imidazolonepropionase-like amidohydrolase
MRGRAALAIILLTGLLAAPLVQSQTPASRRTVAIRAGRLFDPKSGTNLPNQVVLVEGDRIAEVGLASRATVPPGLIDAHVHTMGGPSGLQRQMLVGLANAQRDLDAGFTTIVDMGSHGGGFGTVELRNAIDSGLVRGPRMQVSGPVLSITAPGTTSFPLKFSPAEPNLVADGVDGVRNAVRQLAHYGVNWVKVMSTGPFIFKPDGEMLNQALPSLEELKAIVDEAHRRGLKVASHAYGNDGLDWALEAGVDSIQHAVAASNANIRTFLGKRLPLTATILDMREDEPADLKKFAPSSAQAAKRGYTGSETFPQQPRAACPLCALFLESRFRLMEVTWKRCWPPA